MEARAGTIKIDQLREADPRETIPIAVRRPEVAAPPLKKTTKRPGFFRKRVWADDPRPHSIPGSDHSLLVLPPKAY